MFINTKVKSCHLYQIDLAQNLPKKTFYTRIAYHTVGVILEIFFILHNSSLEYFYDTYFSNKHCHSHW